MKPVSCLFFLYCLFASCAHRAGVKDASSFPEGLIPYTQRYPGSAIKDTLLPGGVYIKYFVGPDTLDATLYIGYGRPGFDSVYKEKDGAPYNCSSWEYAYHTPGAIGLMYECIGGRQLLVLPLHARDSIQLFSPLYVSMEDSLLLVEDPHPGVNGYPALIAADLEGKQRKSFQLSSKVACADVLACFDTIYFNKKLVMQYEAGEEGQEPVTQVQAETLGWKK